MARKIEVIISGDERGLNRSFDRAGNSADGFGRKLGSVAKGVGLAFAAVAVVTVGVGAALGDALGEAREAEKIGKITESVIKSTGGAANLTADQVGKLTAAISEKIGVDDDLIQQSANLLLTFTNVRNEVGAGNDVFARATALSQDMAAVMGTDATGAAMQLGKALNDPLKGIAALGRAGVQFTKDQKEQIKGFVEAGDLLSAQKVILDEVGTQFGGAAEAAATPMDKLGVTIGNLKERIGAGLIPVVDTAATWLSERLPGAIEAAAPWLGKLGDYYRGLFAVFQDLVATFREDGLGGALSYLGERFGEVWPSIEAALVDMATKLWAWIAETVPEIAAQLVAWGKAFVEWVLPQIPPLLVELGHLLSALGAWLIDTALPKLGELLVRWGQAFVGWVLPLVGPLLGELFKLYVRMEQWVVTEALPKIIGALASWALAFLAWINNDVLPKLPTQLWNLLMAIGAWLKDDAIPWAGREFKKFGEALVDAIVEGIKASPGAISDALKSSLIGDDGFGWDDVTPEFPRIPGMPHLAAGGIVTRPTLALIGEAGPEAVVPLDRFGAGAGVGTVNIYAPTNDAAAIVAELGWMLRTR